MEILRRLQSKLSLNKSNNNLKSTETTENTENTETNTPYNPSPTRTIADEIKHIALRAVIFDIIAYLLSTLWLGLNLRFALGLAIGTAVLLINLFILRNSIQRAVMFGTKRAKKIMFAGYMVRMLLFSVAFYVSLVTFFVNSVAVTLPQFYPKIMYAVGATLAEIKLKFKKL
jgi:hypothetical protein